MHLLADMELFVELVKHRNFGRAAAAMGMTASTLSRRMVRFEKQVGVPLIMRSTRSFGLTESGREFYEHSKKVVTEAVRAREEIAANFTRLSGRLRVGAPADLVTTVLAPIFARYCRLNPSLSIEVVATQTQPDLASDSLDVAFAVEHQTKLPDSSLIARQTGSFARMLYASKSYLKRNGTPAFPQQLRDHSCIRYLYMQKGPEKQWDLHQGRRKECVSLTGTVASNSVIVNSQAAREHLGIALLPMYLASHPTFGAGLARVLPDWEGTRVNVFALSTNHHLPTRVQELIRIVREEFSNQLGKLEATRNPDLSR